MLVVVYMNNILDQYIRSIASMSDLKLMTPADFFPIYFLLSFIFDYRTLRSLMFSHRKQMAFEFPLVWIDYFASLMKDEIFINIISWTGSEYLIIQITMYIVVFLSHKSN